MLIQSDPERKVSNQTNKRYVCIIYVRTYVCICACLCAGNPQCTCLSVGMNVVMHSACAQASVRLSVCMRLRACIRLRVFRYECMSVLGTCLHTRVYI